MTVRRVLIIHPDAARRQALRGVLEGTEVVEVESRQAAVPLLAQLDPAVVFSTHDGFKKLLRDLERHAPGAVRAVLCPPGDEAVRRSLVDVAAEGYDFVSLDEGALDRARALVSPRGSGRFVPQRPLVASFRVGSTGFTGKVREIGNDGLGLLVPNSGSSNLLVSGVRLTDLCVVDHGRVLVEPRTSIIRTIRQATAHSNDILVGVSFAAEQEDEAGTVVLSDEVRILGLLHRAWSHGERVHVSFATGAHQRSFEIEGISDETARLRHLEPRFIQPFSPPDIVQVTFEFNGISYEGLSAVFEADEEYVEIAVPNFLRRRQRRRSLRVRCTPDFEAFITLRNPLDGGITTRALIDVQPSGVAFEVDTAAEAMPPGLRLPEVSIEVAGLSLACHATVQTMSAGWRGDSPTVRRCGLSLEGLSPDDLERLLDILIAARAPELEDGRTRPFREVWNMFREEGAKFPDWPAADEAAEEELLSIQDHVSKLPGCLHRAFAYRSLGGKLQGFASGLRIYSRTWLSQHLLVRAGYHRGVHASQSLVQMTFDYGEALPDVDYLRGLWRLSNRWAARVYGASTEKLVRPGRSYLARFHEMRLPTTTGIPAARLSARPTGADDQAAFLSHIRSVYDPVRLKADDLVEGELLLESIGQAYARHGFHRSRQLAVVDGADGPRGWVLLEGMSRGLFWGEMYNSFTLHLVEPGASDADDVRHALVAFALWHARRRGLKVAECHATADDEPLLSRLGFYSLGSLMEFCAHHSMVREMTTELLLIFQRIEVRTRSRVEQEAEATA